MKFCLAMVLCSAVVLMGFSTIGLAQVQERKKREIKRFGSSLNRPPSENIGSPARKKVDNGANDDETIKIETNVVVFDFLVLDQKGTAVSGLNKDDFVITENNEQQEIQTCALGSDAAIPRSIVLIIDYSGTQRPYIERSVNAAKLLVDKLRPNDLMAIVTDDVDLYVPYTNDRKKLKEKLDSLKNRVQDHVYGRSQQFSALYAVLNEMFDEDDIRPIIIFQTDGDQFPALKGQIGALFPFPLTITNFSFDDLVALTEKSRASIYTVFPGPKLLGLSKEERERRIQKEQERIAQSMGLKFPFPKPSKEQVDRFQKIDELYKKYYPNGPPDIQAVLQGLSKHTGGWLDFLEEPEQADEIYSQILNQLDLRYIVGVSPSNETKDGKLRAVKVSVKNHPEYTVWGRKTYIAPSN